MYNSRFSVSAVCQEYNVLLCSYLDPLYPNDLLAQRSEFVDATQMGEGKHEKKAMAAFHVELFQCHELLSACSV